jgi:uncharacterized membrane protein
MIREGVQQYLDNDKGFRYRGVEPGRLENFSDACFALAITLLLISTSPPTNFVQIKKFLFDLIPFILCITLIISIWYQHFIFYYRYGLRDSSVVALNSAFLIIVLFFVYPLKFLTKLALVPIALLFEIDWLQADLQGMISSRDMSDLMIIYGLGAASTSFILMQMYRHALKRKVELQLTELEELDTRMSIRTNFLVGFVPLVSAGTALIFSGHWLGGMIPGFMYFLYGPVMYFHVRRMTRERNKLLARMDQSAQPPQIAEG